MKYLNKEIENKLKNRGAELIRFVNISHLGEKQNRQVPKAIVFALPLTAEYIKMVFDTPDYVQARIDDNYNFAADEYTQTEYKAGEIADELTQFLTGRGYKAVSQSDAGLLADGVFDYEPLYPKCGNCLTCVNICERKVLKGKTWSNSVSRDEIVNIHGCSTCLKCLVHCPRTQIYRKRNSK
jgi:epoxyqueuosine reductase